MLVKTEGDKRTPISVYFVRPKLNQPLPNLYGEGAYPFNDPNEWNKEHHRRACLDRPLAYGLLT